MKKLIQKIREKKGFTLAELLIVVAIIAVLVAIAIPIFTTQLEKSRDATSIANIRSAYAEAQAAYLSEDDSAARVTFTKSGNKITAVAISDVSLKGTQDGWSNMAGDLPADVDWSAVTTDANGAVSGSKTLTFTYADDGTIAASIS